MFYIRIYENIFIYIYIYNYMFCARYLIMPWGQNDEQER